MHNYCTADIGIRKREMQVLPSMKDTFVSDVFCNLHHIAY